jgi:anaerobic selenocysteine-containing dehydrogenase
MNDRDRFRGISGTRMVLFMNRNDIDRLRLTERETVSLVTDMRDSKDGSDGVHRQVDGFIVHAYNIPEGCLGGYFPECNPLIPVWHHAAGSKVPASKGVPVRILKNAIAANAA